MTLLLAEVAVPVPLGRAFSYAVPAALRHRVRPGVRVICPFGARSLLGVVLEVAERTPPVEESRIKAIATVMDTEPVLQPELLAFLRELASYYLAPIGEVLRLALPAVERKQVRELEREGVVAARGDEGKGALFTRIVGSKTVVYASPTQAEPAKRLGAKSAVVLARILERGEVSLPDLEEEWPQARAVLKRLQDQGLVRLSERDSTECSLYAHPVPRDVPPTLTEPQQTAIEAVVAVLSAGRPASFLLHGVTGSGKTEVYFRCIAACLAAERGALVLVPEIALTPQLVARFRARFGDALAVLHSGLADRERHTMWCRLREGAVQVAIGARSALFAPVRKLGLIVVDEEHDGSFKQEEGVRYHARDMALLRAHRANAVAILGSATPSAESEMLARRGKLVKLELPHRARAASAMPTVELVDLKRIGPGPTRNPLLSLPLHRALERTLAAKEQAILFLNRRGFAPSVLCESCGTIVRCKACSVALTFHRARGARLRCHYCDYAGEVPCACPECGAPKLVLEGVGTEKVEEAIRAAFPQARVARLDRDVASGTRAEVVLDQMRARELDVLVGTQMVTKGHDLPEVTLVGVLNADAALAMPDYRAAERSFQLLVQVAGRAGRSEKPGLVIIQTRDPEHPAIIAATRHDVRAFLEHELRDRQELAYPPFSHLALLRIDAVDEERAGQAAEQLSQAAIAAAEQQGGQVDVLGPAPAPIAKVRGRHRFRVLLRAKERRALRAVLLALVPVRDRLPTSVRVVFDVDPVQMM